MRDGEEYMITCGARSYYVCMRIAADLRVLQVHGCGLGYLLHSYYPLELNYSSQVSLVQSVRRTAKTQW
jgi:hypothetical protein